MNVPQRAVLLLGSLLLIAVVLLADGMNWDGLGAIALGGAAALATLLYVLRGKCSGAPVDEWRDRPIGDYCDDDAKPDDGARVQPTALPRRRIVVRRSLVVSAPLRSSVSSAPRGQRA